MRFIIFFLIYGLLSAVLEGTVLNLFPAGKFYSVDLFMMGVAAIAFEDDWQYRTTCLFILAAFKDSISAIPWGASFLSYFIIVFVVRLLSSKISLQPGIARSVWTAVLSVSDKIIISLVLVLAGMAGTSSLILRYSITQSIGDGLASLLFIPIIIWSVKMFCGSFKKKASYGLK